MKVNVVGTSCTWFKRKNTSYVIDDKFVFDVPEGAYKDVLNIVDDIFNVEAVIISHLHTDHAENLHAIATRFIREKPEGVKPLKVFCPKKTFETLIAFNKLFYGGFDECTPEYYEGKVEFVELEDGMTFSLGEYNVTAYKMFHGEEIESFGFSFEDKKGTVVGFSADTKVCENLHKMLKKSNFAFVEMSAVNKHRTHISINEFVELTKQYPNVKIFPVHTNDECQEYAIKNNLNYLIDGQILEF